MTCAIAFAITPFDQLLDQIAAGQMPAIPEHMRDLVERAAAASPIVDVDAWASRLAADIADATEDG